MHSASVHSPLHVQNYLNLKVYVKDLVAYRSKVATKCIPLTSPHPSFLVSGDYTIIKIGFQPIDLPKFHKVLSTFLHRMWTAFVPHHIHWKLITKGSFNVKRAQKE